MLAKRMSLQATRCARLLYARVWMRRSLLWKLVLVLGFSTLILYLTVGGLRNSRTPSQVRRQGHEPVLAGEAVRGSRVTQGMVAPAAPAPPKRLHAGPALTFSEDGEQFLLRGKPLRILSGELHYFRVVPAYWQDRLQRLRAAGLNTVSTYVAWNLHEPHPGEFDFAADTRADLVRFVRTAHALGLYVILRPGPYICAEWEFGGLPGWLLRSNADQLRTNGAWFMGATRRYLARLYALVETLQHGFGGPIIAVQLENEYGTFGDSRPYLEGLKAAAVDAGITELLFKCDDHNGLPKGLVQLPGVLQAVNGNDRVSWHIQQLRQNQAKKAPIFVAELWTGWFTLAADSFRGKTPAEIAVATKQWLERGASINYYMWHGGSNFYHNGAVNIPPFSVITSSYDYDAPVTENGTLTRKFYAVRDQIKAVLGDQVTFGAIPPPVPVRAYGRFPVTTYATLDDVVVMATDAVPLDQVCSMEELAYHGNTGQVMGFTLYRYKRVAGGNGVRQAINIAGLADYGAVLLNGHLLGHVNQQYDSGTGYFIVPPERLNAGDANVLDILVGSTGRNGYLPNGSEKKGLLWPVQLGSERLVGWDAHPMEFDAAFNRRLEAHAGKFRSVAAAAGGSLPAGPLLVRAEFRIADDEAPRDTFLRLGGFGRGLVVLNGEVLGRHWEAGPQRTLYVPAPLLRRGTNVVLVMEMLRTPAHPHIELLDKHYLGKPQESS